MRIVDLAAAKTVIVTLPTALRVTFDIVLKVVPVAVLTWIDASFPEYLFPKLI
jgi:hypothetical protein